MKETNINKRKNNAKKLPVTVILDDSLVKDINGWELSDQSNKVVTKPFSGSSTTDMKSYLLPTKSRHSEIMILHCNTNGLKKENSAN